jgi:hypothetical protein
MFLRWIILGALLWCGPAFAQGQTAQPVTPGYMSTSGCPSAALTPCFVPYGSGGGPGESVTTNPGLRTAVPLDIATVTTGGAAVTALSAGHRTAGGWIANPATATVNLGINEVGTAAGTTSAGNTTFIAPGQTYVLAPSANAVSVIASDSTHPFSGYGWN